jgi:thiamine kinase-like enzyme
MKKKIRLTINKEYKNYSSYQSFIDLEVNEIQITPFFKNKIIYGILPDKSKVIAKIRYKNESDQINFHEWNGLCIAYDNNVPVPEPIALTIFENHRPVIIMREMDGILLNDLIQPKWISCLGETVAKLHKISLNTKAGEQLKILNWEYYHNWIAEIAQDQYFRDNPKELQMLIEFENIAKYQLQYNFTSFLHNDIHHSQAIVNRELQQVILIDFEQWKCGDPLSDFSIYLYHLIRQNQPKWCFDRFLVNQKEKNPIFGDITSIIKFYLLFISSRAIYLLKEWDDWGERSIVTQKEVLEFLKNENNFLPLKTLI